MHTIRTIDDQDVSWILALNAQNEEATGPLDAARLRLMLGDAFHARAVNADDGFIIPFEQSSAYWSENYKWFRDRYPRFVYVDRIVISASARRGGLARVLYTDVFDAARRAGRQTVGGEVNVDPPNPASDAFHNRLGFVEVGRATLTNGKTVRYMIKDLS
jgi:uncharacterized protein